MSAASGDDGEHLQRLAVASRLRAAVRHGGGNKVVSENSGVKLSTLNNYLRSVHRVPVQAASKIATASGVDVRWVLNGTGSMVLSANNVSGAHPSRPLPADSVTEPRLREGWEPDGLKWRRARGQVVLELSNLMSRAGPATAVAIYHDAIDRLTDLLFDNLSVMPGGEGAP